MGYQDVHIAPSILAADFTRLGEQIQAAEAGGAHMIHMDVMDGRFVPNITMGPLVVEAARRATHLPLDVHLMIVEPEKYIAAFAEAGADNITIHVEATAHLHRALQQIRAAGCRVGVAINPATPPVMLKPVMPMIDIVNIMTVNPGFGGQAFLPDMMSKIAELRAMAGSVRRAVDIEVDGGINAQTAAAAVQSGSNILVVGSAIFKHPDGVQAGMKALRAALED